jgi:hypothetical protein
MSRHRMTCRGNAGPKVDEPAPYDVPENAGPTVDSRWPPVRALFAACSTLRPSSVIRASCSPIST